MDSFLTEEERAARLTGAPFSSGRSWLRSALDWEERAKALPVGERPAFPRVPDPGDEAVSSVLAEIGSILGSASGTLDRCYAAARAQGYFESTLMGFRDVHMELSELHSSLESVRLMTYRACRLLDRGDRERGGEELVRARAMADDIASRAGGAARRLLARETT